MIRNTRSLRNFLILISTLSFSGLSALAQTPPPQNLVAQVKRAVVVVTTYDQTGNALKQGSGFFIDSDRIVTNFHVIDTAAEIRVKTFTGKTVLVKTVLASDREADLTILQISEPCPDTTTLEIADISPVVGERLVVVSNPTGSHWKVTAGQVGSTWNFEHLGSRMRITASLGPGSSGGPVVNLQGHVIGIAVMHTGSADDLDFAVPVERLKSLQTAVAPTSRRTSTPRN